MHRVVWLISCHTSFTGVQSVIFCLCLLSCSLLPLIVSSTAGAMICHQYEFAYLRFSVSAQTMQQNNPAKCAVHNKQAIMGRMA